MTDHWNWTTNRRPRTDYMENVKTIKIKLFFSFMIVIPD